jgi:hypothetical protein
MTGEPIQYVLIGAVLLVIALSVILGLISLLSILLMVLLPIVVPGGAAYLVYRWWKSRS